MPEQNTQEPATEERILAAARKVFYQHGYHGARMQDIANEAGINKAMLHYYFRSKDKLFDAIFSEAIGRLLPSLLAILTSDSPLEDKIEAYVQGYSDFMLANPELPTFVLRELSSNPERLTALLGARGLKPPGPLLAQFEAAIARSGRQNDDGRQVFVSMLALCIFPFIAAPIIRTLLNLDDEGYKAFLQERKQHIPEFFLRGLQ